MPVDAEEGVMLLQHLMYIASANTSCGLLLELLHFHVLTVLSDLNL
jgi:hypothetical protein